MENEKKVIEEIVECPECGNKHLLSYLCSVCSQKKGLLEKNKVLTLPGNVNLVSLQKIKDGDILVLSCKEEMNNEMHQKLEKLAKKIKEYTQKNVIFILKSDSVNLSTIPDEMLSRVGLKRIEPVKKEIQM